MFKRYGGWLIKYLVDTFSFVPPHPTNKRDNFYSLDKLLPTNCLIFSALINGIGKVKPVKGLIGWLNYYRKKYDPYSFA